MQVLNKSTYQNGITHHLCYVQTIIKVCFAFNVLEFSYDLSTYLYNILDLGPGVVCHYEVASIFEYDDNYVLRPSQIVTEYCDVLVVSYAVLDVNRLQIGAFSQDEERKYDLIWYP